MVASTTNIKFIAEKGVNYKNHCHIVATHTNHTITTFYGVFESSARFRSSQ